MPGVSKYLTRAAAKEASLFALSIYMGGRAALILSNYYACTKSSARCLRDLFIDIAKELPFADKFQKLLLDIVKRL
jgi:hypothetical protein